MQVRHAIAAVTVAAFALSLSACTNDAHLPITSTPAPTDVQATTEPTTSAAPSATAGAKTPDAADVTMRDIVAPYDLVTTSTSLRTGFASWNVYTDDEIAIILNAGCDALDAEGNPVAAADAMAAYGLAPADAAFGVLASISNYCPEYSEFLGGS